MSDFEFNPIHKFFKITISSIKYLKKHEFRHHFVTRV